MRCTQKMGRGTCTRPAVKGYKVCKKHMDDLQKESYKELKSRKKPKKRDSEVQSAALVASSLMNLIQLVVRKEIQGLKITRED